MIALENENNYCFHKHFVRCCKKKIVTMCIGFSESNFTKFV